MTARGKSAEVGAQERQMRTGLHYLAYVGRIHIGSHAREKKSRKKGWEHLKWHPGPSLDS